MENTDSVQDVTDLKGGHYNKYSSNDIIDLIDDSSNDTIPINAVQSNQSTDNESTKHTTNGGNASSNGIKKVNAFDELTKQSKRQKTQHNTVQKSIKPVSTQNSKPISISDKQVTLLTQLKQLLNITSAQHDRTLVQLIDNENNNLDRLVGKLIDNTKYKYLFESDTSTTTNNNVNTVHRSASTTPTVSPEPVQSPPPGYLTLKNKSTITQPVDKPTWKYKLLLETTINGTSTTSGRNFIKRTDYVNLRADQCPIHTKSTTELSTKLHKKDRYGKIKAVTREQCTHCQRRILRFCTLPPDNREIGSVARDLTNILLPLIDTDCIVLEAQIIDCPSKLDIFSTVLLNVKVFVTPSIFEPPPIVKSTTLQFDKTESVATNPRAEAIYDLLQYARIKPVDTAMKLDELEKKGDQLTEQAKLIQSTDNSTDTEAVSTYDEDTADTTDTNDAETNALRVSKIQLDSLYASSIASNMNLPEMDEPSGFKAVLRQYQKQALYWCTQREQTDAQKQQKQQNKVMSPLWDKYCFVDKTVFYLNSFSFQISLTEPELVGQCRGGILADEMGMGKTVMSLSLIVTNHRDNIDTTDDNSDIDDIIKPKSYKGKQYGNSTTLIVCPMSLIGQWCDEIKKHTNLTYERYYGDTRNNSIKYLTQYDVIVTTYGTIASEYRQLQLHNTQSALFNIEWYRIMLDEAHIIRNRKTENAKSCFELHAIHKWCLTGTPIQNNLNDIYSLLHYLNEQPWCDYGWWHRIIAKPYEHGDIKALQRLKAVLHPLMLRRTKNMTDSSGNNILTLPEKQEEIVELELSHVERLFYNNLYEKSKLIFDQFIDNGVVLNKYIEILTLILRLRQCCDHPFLLLGKNKSADEFTRDIDLFVASFIKKNQSVTMSDKYIQSLKNNIFDKSVERQCCICLTDLDSNTAVLTNCGHAFDRDCIMPIFNADNIALCPICRTKIYVERLSDIPQQSALFNFDPVKQWKHSSKTEYLLNELKNKSPEDKCLIFSQWTSMLDLIEIPLKQQKYKYLRLDGTYSQQQREKLLQQFRTDPSISILLISLKAGGVGLNLVTANIVYFLDCWWNPAVEDQAIQRVHRIGQTKPVYVKRFIVKNTVEQRIIALQEKKKQLAASVGMSEEDVQNNRMEDIKSLFKSI